MSTTTKRNPPNMERKTSAAFITAAAGVAAKGGDATTRGNMVRKKSAAMLNKDDGGASEPKEAQANAVDIVTEHTMTFEEIEDLYTTNSRMGLTEEAYDQNIATYGENKLTPPEETPLYVKFIMHQISGFALLLWGGAALCFIAYALESTAADNLYLGIVLSSVVFLTGCFAFYQEYDAESTMAGFRDLTPDRCTVIRNYAMGSCAAGEKTLNYPAEGLARGDVVVVEQGSKLPADIVIIECQNMKVDNAALTGEAEPLTRTHKRSPLDTEIPVTEREAKNYAFYGTYCTEGSCHGFVVRTGDMTAVGKIATAVTQSVAPPTTMELEIEHFIHLVSGVAVFIGVTFFIIAMITGYTLLEAIVFMIGIIVANVPEGLLATVTVALSLTAKQMLKNNVLVKSAQTIETLGSITHVASDKTGTLTQNLMTVTHGIHSMKIIALAESLNIKGGIMPSGKVDSAQGVVYDQEDEDWVRLQRCACICGKAVFELKSAEGTMYFDDEAFKAGKSGWSGPLAGRQVDGDATEGGLLKFCEPIFQDLWWNKTHTDGETAVQYVQKYRSLYKMVGKVPFNSNNKYMVTMHVSKPECEPAGWKSFFANPEDASRNEEGKYVILLKGAPDKLIDACRYMRCAENAGCLEQPFGNSGKTYKEYFEEIRTQHIEGTDESLANDMTKGEKSACNTNPCAIPYTDQLRKETFNLQMKLASEGERVLGFAEYVCSKEEFEKLMDETFKDSPGDKNDEQGNWNLSDPAVAGSSDGEIWQRATFLGMISLEDPPRTDVPEAITTCHTAGIDVVMVTGDHPVTAKAISEKINILDGSGSCSISDWVAYQQENIGQPGFMTQENLDKLLKDYLWLPANDKEVERGSWGDTGNAGRLAGLAIKDDGDDHTRCHDPKVKWWMGHRLHDHRGYPLTIPIVADSDGNTEIFDPVKGLVVAGGQIDLFNDNDWRYALSRRKLTFARTLPEQKQQIVMNMQRFHTMMSMGAETDKPEKATNNGDDGEGIPGSGICEESNKVILLEAGWTRSATFLEDDGRSAGPGIDLTKHIFTERSDLEQPRVVAVTGDGVNDSPALKKADCGIAMGICGADVAKNAADMILMKDEFSAIVEGIRQGRLIFDNLKKSIAYTLTSNIPEITPFLALIILQIPIPLETVMILCIDLGTDMLPAISLAYEEPENDIMLRQPRDKNADHLVNDKLIGLTYGMIGMVQAAAGFTCYYAVLASYNLNHEDISGTGFKYISKDEKFVCGLDYDTRMGYLRQAQTSFLMSIIVVQWADVMICKTRMKSIVDQGMKNNVLIIGLIEELLLGFVLSYVPFANTAFKTAPLDFVMWTYGIPFAILILLFDEGRKWLLRREVEAGKAAVAGTDEKPAIGFVENCTYY